MQLDEKIYTCKVYASVAILSSEVQDSLNFGNADYSSLTRESDRKGKRTKWRAVGSFCVRGVNQVYDLAIK